MNIQRKVNPATLLLSVLVLKLVNCISRHPIVIIIAFDGYRYDYINRGFNPVLKKLAHDGVRTTYLESIFPTVTYTNFFAISTGLYAESHGVLGDSVFNNEHECIDYSYELFHYNRDVVPIWILNEITGKGRYSGCMMWPSSNFAYQNKKPTYVQSFNPLTLWIERVNKVMKWILDPEKPANLVHLYFEEPDFLTHPFGTDSNVVNEQLKRVDKIIEYLLNLLSKHNLRDRVNLIILSDHGMSEINKKKDFYLTTFIDESKYKQCGDPPVVQLRPKLGYGQQIYENLTRAANKLRSFNVYKQAEVPTSLHWKNNERSEGLLVVANNFVEFGSDTDYQADHGYPPKIKQMHAFFAASGPLFKKQFYISSLHNIDIYPLIVRILDLKPPDDYVKPNGTLNKISKILVNN